jgi:hypothetical protein
LQSFLLLQQHQNSSGGTSEATMCKNKPILIYLGISWNYLLNQNHSNQKFLLESYYSVKENENDFLFGSSDYQQKKKEEIVEMLRRSFQQSTEEMMESLYLSLKPFLEKDNNPTDHNEEENDIEDYEKDSIYHSLGDRDHKNKNELQWKIQPINIDATEDNLQNGFLSGLNWLWRCLLSEV